MPRKNGWSNYIFVSIAVSMTVMAISLMPQFAYKTTDDSKMLYRYLESSSKGQVLGANSSAEDKLCPASQPVVGWINFQGKKLITRDIPQGEKASACFRSLSEARESGFVETNQ